MDAIHKPHLRTWIDHNVINVRQFLDEWMEALTLPSDDPAKSDKSQKSQKGFSNIEKQCGLDSMKCLYQERVEPADNIEIPSGVDLQTIKDQKEDLDKRANDNRYTCAHYVNLKYLSYPPHKVPKVDNSNLEHVPIEVPEVVLSVQIYTPERRLDPKTTLGHIKMPVFHINQEFLVLGCQRLTELRDKIDCVSDRVIPGEHSDCPTHLPNITCKDLYKSGFFYINGVFYNDMRDKDCRDYSESILTWAKKGKRGVGPFKKALMEETKFLDISICLGYPYVYVHQGECEHLIVFSDLRLFTKHEEQNRNAYPMYVQVKPNKRIFCMVCRAFTAVWVVFDNKRLPENPYFFCKKCFFSFNYDANNRKIGEFKAYHFPDHTILF